MYNYREKKQRVKWERKGRGERKRERRITTDDEEKKRLIYEK